MSILQVDLKIPGGMYVQLPLLVTTTFVGYVPSNASSALEMEEEARRRMGGKRRKEAKVGRAGYTSVAEGKWHFFGFCCLKNGMIIRVKINVVFTLSF